MENGSVRGSKVPSMAKNSAEGTKLIKSDAENYLHAATVGSLSVTNRMQKLSGKSDHPLLLLLDVSFCV